MLSLGAGFFGFKWLNVGKALATSFQPQQPKILRRPQWLGTTFSQLQCHYMGLDYRESFQQLLSLGFDCIRLCSYWNEVEAQENQFNFTTLDWLLDECHKHKVSVVLTVGMKAPRWPEFHFPDWVQARYDTSSHPKPIDRQTELADRTLQFTEKVVAHTKASPVIQYWQVENEPFTRMDITGGRYLSHEFVQREVELVRSRILPHQQILLTNAITLPAAQIAEDDHAFQKSLALADGIGINVYTKVPIANSAFYVEPLPPFWTKLNNWQSLIQDANKTAWIAEAQAEPWEPNELVAMKKTEYPSSTPKRLENLVVSLTDIGYSPVLLWGCEYWYWNKKNGRNLWWWTVERLIESDRPVLN